MKRSTINANGSESVRGRMSSKNSNPSRRRPQHTGWLACE